MRSGRLENGGKVVKCFLMLDLVATSAFGKRQIQSYAGNHCLPGFVFGEATPLNGTPKMNDFLFGHALEKILITLPV